MANPNTSNIRMGPISKYNSAKEYLDMHDIPKMFESLFASLMIEKPEHHLQYLDTKLEEIKEMGIENVNWESFIHHLHPSRDPLRQELLKTEPTEEEKKKGQPQFADEKDNLMDTKPDDNYKPELFNLTEPQDDEY